MMQFQIGNRKIGPGNPTFVIAEVGFNHGGDMDLAREMIRAAAKTGADAVKFQTYKANHLVQENSPHFDLIKSGELNLQQHKELVQEAQKAGILFFSTPFDIGSAAILHEVGVPAFKVASMDLTYFPLLKWLAQTGKPILLSTGMGTLAEIQSAYQFIKASGSSPVALLHCISKYPPAIEESHVHNVAKLALEFECPVGYSDHVIGPEASLAAVALGASVIEKHFTTDKKLPGPDHVISADPAELTSLVQSIRRIEASLGRPCLDDSRPDREFAKLFRRGVFANEAIPAGAVVTESMLKYVRPEADFTVADLRNVLGKKVSSAIEKNAPIAPTQLV